MAETTAENTSAPTPNDAAAQSAPPERTFTQAEMDKIIGERLSGVHQRYADYDDLKAAAEKAAEVTAELDTTRAELAAAKDAQMRGRIASEAGVPVELLKGDTEEDLTASATALAAFISSSGKPGAVVGSVGTDDGSAMDLHSDAGARLVLGL